MKNMLITIMASLVAFVGNAQAALSPVVGTTITEIQTDGLALVDLIWPVVGSITAAFIIIKLFKRGTAKV